MSPPADDPIDTSIPALPAIRCASGSLYNCVDRENTGSSSPEAIFFCSKGLFLFMDWGCELLWHGFVMHIYIRRAPFTLVVQYCGNSGLQLHNNTIPLCNQQYCGYSEAGGVLPQLHVKRTVRPVTSQCHAVYPG